MPVSTNTLLPLYVRLMLLSECGSTAVKMQYLVLPYKLGTRNKVEAQQAQACMTEPMPQTRHLR